MKQLLKDPSVCIFAELALVKAAELQMNAEELNLAYHFASKHFKDCDEFVKQCVLIQFGGGTGCAVGTSVECIVLEFTPGA